MLHLYHIPGVRIEASKDHRAIQRRQHAFLGRPRHRGRGHCSGRQYGEIVDRSPSPFRVVV